MANSTSSRKGMKLYHYCTMCENIVAKKKTEPFKSSYYKCRHDPNEFWKRIYLIEEEDKR